MESVLAQRRERLDDQWVNSGLEMSETLGHAAAAAASTCPSKTRTESLSLKSLDDGR
jgi:hypothetical protein